MSIQKLYLQLAVIGLLSTAAAHTSPAQFYSLVQGTQELQLSGAYQPGRLEGDVLSLRLGYGFFVREGLLLGPAIAFYQSDRQDYWNIEFRAEQHFPLRAPPIPYVGGGLGYQNTDAGESTDALYLDLVVGAKLFLINDLALDLSLHNALATEDIYSGDEEDGRRNHETRVDLGLRYFF